jgi:hypothetical protein
MIKEYFDFNILFIVFYVMLKLIVSYFTFLIFELGSNLTNVIFIITVGLDFEKFIVEII